MQSASRGRGRGEREIAGLREIGLDPSEIDLGDRFGALDHARSTLEDFDAVCVLGGNVVVLRTAFHESGAGPLVIRQRAVAAAGTCTVTMSPPPERGVRATVPSWASTMLLTIARPRPTPRGQCGLVRCRAETARQVSTRVAGLSSSPVFSTVSTTVEESTLVVTQTTPSVRHVVHDRVVEEVRRHLPQERGRPDRRGEVAGGLDGDALLLGQRPERFGGLFGDQGQVDLFSGRRTAGRRG